MDEHVAFAPTVALGEPRPKRRAPVSRHEMILTILIAAEVGVFGILGRNFATATNMFEIIRLSTEIGLVAVALTPVVLSGGIDLSVGSMMGLAAVVFGIAVKQLHLGAAGGAALALAVGATGGGLNALFVTRLRIPALIVTLATAALFRGIAEELTGSVKSFTPFSESFLALGQGSFLFNAIPMQLPILLAVALAYHRLLERSTVGRALRAIGHSPDGARQTGIPVRALPALVYILAAMIASMAGIVYVARLGHAKADAGTSYELMALTAVVLGGASIVGGRGSIRGTLLGVFAIAILLNGLQHADLPAELGGILVGVLLVTAVLVDRSRQTPTASL